MQNLLFEKFLEENKGLVVSLCKQYRVSDRLNLSIDDALNFTKFVLYECFLLAEKKGNKLKPTAYFRWHLDHIISKEIGKPSKNLQSYHKPIQSPYESIETNDFISQAIKKSLSDTEQEIIRHRFWDGKTLAETGQCMNIPLPSVYKIEQDALTKLREFANSRDLLK